MILSFGQSCPSQRYSKQSQGHNTGTKARLQMWKKEMGKKKAQECTTENTVLITRVSSHCTTRTEHMGSARSRGRGTGGESRVLAASMAWGVASMAQGVPRMAWRVASMAWRVASMAGHLCWDGDSCTSSGRRAPTVAPQARAFSAPWASPPTWVPALLTLAAWRSACPWFYHSNVFVFYHYCINYVSVISLYFYRDHEARFLKPEVLRTTPIIHFTSPILVE